MGKKVKMSPQVIEAKFLELEKKNKSWNSWTKKEQEVFHQYMELILNKHLDEEPYTWS